MTIKMGRKTFELTREITGNLACVLQGAYKDNGQEPPVTLVNMAEVASNELREMAEAE